MSLSALVGLLILLPNNLRADSENFTRAPRFDNQCIKLLDSSIFRTERLSMRIEKEADGCIKEKTVEFFRSIDCTGEGEPGEMLPPESSVVYKSGLDGGCPESIEVTHASPACIWITFKSGRRVKYCY